MYKQLYYGTKNGFNLRVITLLIVIAINLILFISANPSLNVSIAIVMTVSSFSFIGLVFVNLIVTFSNLHKIFSPPDSYFTLLAPVSSYKILLGNIIPSVLFDSIGFVVGVGWMLLHAVRFSGWDTTGEFTGLGYLWFAVAIILIGYAILLVAFTFLKTISRSVFYRFPLRRLFSLAATFAAMLALSWLNLLLVPFGIVERFGIFIAISLQTSHLDAFLVFLVMLLQAAILFFATAYLMDRRMNI